jgi:predicted PurR-regulated permease PerM
MLSPAPEHSRAVTVSVVVLAVVAAAAALAYTRPVMVPFVLALFLSYLVSPLVDLLEDRFRVPRFVSILIALLTAVGVLTLLALLIMTSARGLMASADIYRDRILGLLRRESGAGHIPRGHPSTSGAEVGAECRWYGH